MSRASHFRRQVRIWHGGLDIKIADDYNAKKNIELDITGLNPEIYYKLRVFGYSRGGEGTMSSPAVEFLLGKFTSFSALPKIKKEENSSIVTDNMAHLLVMRKPGEGRCRLQG